MIGVIENKTSVVVEKLRQIEVEISELQGGFNLFALIEREDSLGRWDLVVSAEWIGNNQKRIIDMIAYRISNKLEKEEQLMLSRILILSPSDHFVQSFSVINVEHGNASITDTTFNGVVVRKAFLITSRTLRKRVLKADERPKK